MEQKLVKVPFDVEMAKKISDKSIEGKITTKNDENARIICWDARNDSSRPIVALISKDRNNEQPIVYNLQGKVINADVIDTNDLMLEIPIYMSFKDGDILSDDMGFIFIFNGNGECKISSYACLTPYGTILFDGAADMSRIDKYRYATTEEKQKFIEALKESKEPEAKEYINRFFSEHSNLLNIGKNYEFQVGQPVIGVDFRGEWRYDLFSHFNPDRKNSNYVCSGRSYNKCLPYNKETAHLVGTKDMQEK